MIVCAGATVAAAACMMGDCGKLSPAFAKEFASRACGHGTFDCLPERRRGSLVGRGRRLDCDPGRRQPYRAPVYAAGDRAAPVGGIQSG